MEVNHGNGGAWPVAWRPQPPRGPPSGEGRGGLAGDRPGPERESQGPPRCPRTQQGRRVWGQARGLAPSVELRPPELAFAHCPAISLRGRPGGASGLARGLIGLGPHGTPPTGAPCVPLGLSHRAPPQGGPGHVRTTVCHWSTERRSARGPPQTRVRHQQGSSSVERAKIPRDPTEAGPGVLRAVALAVWHPETVKPWASDRAWQGPQRQRGQHWAGNPEGQRPGGWPRSDLMHTE